MKKYTINKGCILQQLDDAFVIFDPEESFLITLRGTGKFIFEQLKKNQPLAQIINDLVRTYNVEKQIAYRDVHEYVNSLLKMKIIQK